MVSQIRAQQGLTLIEIMVALTLSLVLMGGVIQLFLSSKQTYRTNEALASLQESARFALDNITRDARIASYQGCLDPNDPRIFPGVAVINNPPLVSFMESGIEGTEGSAASDSLTLRSATAVSASLVQDTDPVNGSMVIDVNRQNIATDNIVVIADCATAHVVRVTDVTIDETTGNTTISFDATENDLAVFENKAYQPINTKVMGFSTAEYTVADTGRKNTRGEAIFALFRNGVELVEGVEQLQVQYGERVSNDTKVRFVDADDGSLDMTKVVSVRIGLLVAATQATAGQDDNQTYSLVGTAVGPAGGGTTVTHAVDQRIRRAFNTTISLRNRR